MSTPPAPSIDFDPLSPFGEHVLKNLKHPTEPLAHIFPRLHHLSYKPNPRGRGRVFSIPDGQYLMHIIGFRDLLHPYQPNASRRSLFFSEYTGERPPEGVRLNLKLVEGWSGKHALFSARRTKAGKTWWLSEYHCIRPNHEVREWLPSALADMSPRLPSGQAAA